MKNVICIYHVPQECGNEALIFVDTFDGQIIKTITVNYFKDWDAFHPELRYGNEIIFYRTAGKCYGFAEGERLYYDGDEAMAGFKDEAMKELIHPAGGYLVTACEIIGTNIIKGVNNEPIALDVWKITMCECAETGYKYYPEEDRFYKELNDQGIELDEMSEEEWQVTKIQDVIDLIAEQLGFRVLNIINC